MDTQGRISKGIVLAGGRGTRLYPLTLYQSKQLLPVHDKPMIYYPLSTLMLGGVRDILVISGPAELPSYERLLGDGSRFGVKISYAAQDAPRGLADAFRVGERWMDGQGSALILGDNVFWGYLDFLRSALDRTKGATIWAYPVHDPERYGVVEFDANGRAIHIEEKPTHPRSRFAIPGVYVFDRDVCEIAKKLTPSPRGELEIVDVQRAYLERGDLHVAPLGRGLAWLDTGTVQSLMEASEFVAVIERRQGLKIGCLEEVALRMGNVTKDELRKTIAAYPASEYRTYIEAVLDE